MTGQTARVAHEPLLIVSSEFGAIEAGDGGVHRLVIASNVPRRVEMEAGHGGKSGRFQRYHDTALEYAFILQQLGVDE